jgi:hypothetical protein
MASGLDGEWRVIRTGGFLPPLAGVCKRIEGDRGFVRPTRFEGAPSVCASKKACGFTVSTSYSSDDAEPHAVALGEVLERRELICDSYAAYFWVVVLGSLLTGHRGQESRCDARRGSEARMLLAGRKKMVVVALAAAASVPGNGAVSARGGSSAPLQATAACAARGFTVSFNPAASAAVANQGQLALISFTKRWLSPSCRSVAAPRVYRENPLVETHRRMVIRCAAPRSIKIHVNAIINGDNPRKEPIGNTVVVGFGEPLTVIASAVLKNKGDPQATSLYRSRRYCKSLM